VQKLSLVCLAKEWADDRQGSSDIVMHQGNILAHVLGIIPFANALGRRLLVLKPVPILHTTKGANLDDDKVCTSKGFAQRRKPPASISVNQRQWILWDVNGFSQMAYVLQMLPGTVELGAIAANGFEQPAGAAN
jgi:hypothetical protein